MSEDVDDWEERRDAECTNSWSCGRLPEVQSTAKVEGTSGCIAEMVFHQVNEVVLGRAAKLVGF